MTITEVSYARLFKTDQFENERIGLTAKVEEGESAQGVLELLKTRVISFSEQTQRQKEEAKVILRNKRHRTMAEVEWALDVQNGKTIKPLKDYTKRGRKELPALDVDPEEYMDGAFD